MCRLTKASMIMLAEQVERDGKVLNRERKHLDLYTTNDA